MVLANESEDPVFILINKISEAFNALLELPTKLTNAFNAYQLITPPRNTASVPNLGHSSDCQIGS